MNQTLPLMTDEEIRLPAEPDAGFGALQTEKGPLPLKALDVQARIDSLLARTTVCQTFVNTFNEPLEATYIFPLPDRAAITALRMEVAGRVIEAALKERAEARREYDQAIQTGQRAALAEEDRSGVFTLKVGNLMPGEQAVLRLTLCGPLMYSDGEATYRFPLVVAPRYIPGTPLPGPSVGEGVASDTDAVPDASRISPPVLLPGFPNPVRLSLTVEVHGGGMPIGDFRSSLHAIGMDDAKDGRRITLQPNERLNRDFILRFRVGESGVRTGLVLQPDADGKEGTFLLTVVPPVGEAQKQRPRDVIFVLDRSGSMGGWKMVAARRALGRMVDTLTERDRFTVYAFDDTIETPPHIDGKGLAPATDRNRFRVVEFLAKIESRGGTELAQPLVQAVATLATEGHDAEDSSVRDRILVLVTDGQVGNEDQILRALGNHIRDLRIFTLGIDKAVNEAFLKRLAGLGGGACELVESEDRLDEVMDKVHRRIGTPMLTGLRMEPGKLEIDSHSIVPRRLPELFAGAPLMIQGRYRGAAQGSVAVRATDAAGRAWTETVTAERANEAALAATWARGHIRDLEDHYASGGDRTKLEKQIVQTSLRFGVLCRFTAFIAVDVKEVVNPGGQVHRVTQPVEPAAGWAMLGTDAQGEMDSAMTLFSMSRRLACSEMPMYMASDLESEEVESIDGIMMGRPEAGYKSDNSTAVPSPPLARYKRDFPILSRPDGLFRRLGRVFRGRAKQPPAAAPMDLTAYRRRVQELLQRLRNTTEANRLTELGVLSVRLAELIEDQRSTGAPDAEIRPLEELLKELQALLAETPPAESAVAMLFAKAVVTLQAFASATPLAGRRGEFWK
jgi:Ca-activated chloride channel family protein